MFPFGMSCPFVPLNIHQCQNRQQKWLVCELYEMLLERVLNIWVDLNIELNKKWEGRGGSFYLLCHCKVHQCKSKVSRLLWPDDHYLSTVICFRLEYQTKIMWVTCKTKKVLKIRENVTVMCYLTVDGFNLTRKIVKTLKCEKFGKIKCS